MSGRSSSPVRLFRTGRKERTVFVVAVAGHQEVALDQPLRLRVRRHKANLPALALHLEVDHALAALQILYLQAAQFFPAHAVIEQGRKNRPITHVLQRVFRRCFEKPPYLFIFIREGRGRTLVTVRH